MGRINSDYSQIVERGTAACEKEVQKDARISEELSFFIRETFKDFIDSGDFLWTETNSHEEFAAYVPNYKGKGVLNRLNDIRYINTFLEVANENLQVGGFLVVNVETKNARRERIFDKYPKLVSRPYYLLDFILKRVLPKWKLTYKLYYSITGGRNRVLSKTETLGRLYASGFTVLSHRRIGYNTWFIARKDSVPVSGSEFTYGFFIKLNRVGLNGDMIGVYKLRTMHPFSEHIQGYVYENNSLKNGGKLKDDFRITSWGKVFRKLWIDELPMLYNWLKRDLKIVGVRPLSRHYYDLYPEEVQLLRNTVKPGLVPPYYADMPQTFEEIVESERRYLESYKKQPLRTDIRYFYTAMINILFKSARSS